MTFVTFSKADAPAKFIDVFLYDMTTPPRRLRRLFGRAPIWQQGHRNRRRWPPHRGGFILPEGPILCVDRLGRPVGVPGRRRLPGRHLRLPPGPISVSPLKPSRIISTSADSILCRCACSFAVICKTRFGPPGIMLSTSASIVARAGPRRHACAGSSKVRESLISRVLVTGWALRQTIERFAPDRAVERCGRLRHPPTATWLALERGSHALACVSLLLDGSPMV
jgi:hypothetical protein